MGECNENVEKKTYVGRCIARYSDTLDMRQCAYVALGMCAQVRACVHVRVFAIPHANCADFAGMYVILVWLHKTLHLRRARAHCGVVITHVY